MDKYLTVKVGGSNCPCKQSYAGGQQCSLSPDQIDVDEEGGLCENCPYGKTKEELVEIGARALYNAQNPGTKEYDIWEKRDEVIKNKYRADTLAVISATGGSR